ncbi:MAG: Asp-tRNA(Asn)/Glu-tRNA(Gln) amidotransferase subunit GatC [Candidatus Paceibacterota bacterium]|jgi:aspartyl/glutamyl-tRNA(Asn/Gln) amidotransferase C subunit
MKIDDVKKLAELSRIEMSESEMQELLLDMKSILGYIDQIQTLTDADSTQTNAGTELSLYNVMREDENPHESGINTEKILEESPDRDGNYFKVKQIF